MLSREYCRRGEFFFKSFADNPDNTYEKEVIDAYAEGLQFVPWMSELDVDSQAFEEAMMVRRLSPRSPGEG